MAERPGLQGLVDAVQTFDASTVVASGLTSLASSPNSHISVLRIARGGDAEINPPGSDEILVVLEGECQVQTAHGMVPVRQNQGVLIPPATHGRLVNSGGTDLVVFSMATKHPSAAPPNQPSDVRIKVPLEYIDAKGIRKSVYAYAMDRTTIGISPVIMEEWNQVSVLRMNCSYEQEGDHILAKLPERIVSWYRLEGLTDDDYLLRPDRTRVRVRVNLTPFHQRQLG
jgi:mannose-6-phosphate isomerase-like protein (cupin superfamily)